MTPTRERRRLLLLFALALAACTGDDMVARFMPDGADRRARDYLGLLTRGETDSAAARVVPQLRSAEGRAQLDSLAVFLRGRVFDSVRVIGVQVNEMAGERHVNLTYQVHSMEGWAVANVATVERDSTWAVEGVTARDIPASLEEINAFSLSGRSPRHYLWLLLTCLAAATSIGVATRVGLARAMPKRWRWVFLALIGVVQFTLDWTSGAWAVQPIRVQLLSAGFMKAGPVAPWMLSFSLPLGAAIALWRYRRWRREQAAATDVGGVPRPPEIAL